MSFKPIEMNLERQLLFAALEEIKTSHPTAHVVLNDYVIKKVQEEQENEE